MKILSIIIPIYNSGKYLERCLMSCLKQGFTSDELEIILCDDASTDDSLSIAESLGRQYENVTVISLHQNAGAGIARNMGLDQAQGAYIMFVDSDDYLAEDSVRQVMNCCQEHELDVCKFGIERQYLDSGHIKKDLYSVDPNIIYSGFEALENNAIPLDSACNAIYCRRFLEDNKLRFISMRMTEDVVFTLEVFMTAKRMMFHDSIVYVYEIKSGTRGNPTSLLGRLEFAKGDITIASLMREKANTSEISKSTRTALNVRCNSAVISAIWWLRDLKEELTQEQFFQLLQHGKSLGVYPIKGHALTWRSTLLAHIFINREWIAKKFFCRKCCKK